MTSFEDVEVDDNESEIGRSDILLSPPVSDEEDGGISSHPDVEFHEVDLVNPNLKLKMKFASIQLFREAIRQLVCYRRQPKIKPLLLKIHVIVRVRVDPT
jgi:hypothetical protein